jgi:hypothetical protein
MIPVRIQKMHKQPFSLILIFFVLLTMAFLSCANKDEIKCEGCDKDTPWSNSESYYCYSSRDSCEIASGKECEKCK